MKSTVTNGRKMMKQVKNVRGNRALRAPKATKEQRKERDEFAIEFLIRNQTATAAQTARHLAGMLNANDKTMESYLYKDGHMDYLRREAINREIRDKAKQVGKVLETIKPPESESRQVVNFCPGCGDDKKERQKFCAECGEDLKGVELAMLRSRQERRKQD